MTIRHNIVYALLALLLVLSQQMGFAHAVSHWSGVGSGTEQVQDADTGFSPGLALDHNCSQCLAFAQIATAVGTPSFSFPAVDYAAPIATAFSVPQACQRTVCVFQSRAPPLA